MANQPELQDIITRQLDEFSTQISKILACRPEKLWLYLFDTIQLARRSGRCGTQRIVLNLENAPVYLNCSLWDI